LFPLRLAPQKLEEQRGDRRICECGGGGGGGCSLRHGRRGMEIASIRSRVPVSSRPLPLPEEKSQEILVGAPAGREGLRLLPLRLTPGSSEPSSARIGSAFAALLLFARKISLRCRCC